MSDVASQMRPFDVVQSSAKQEQLAVLGDVPSSMGHGSNGLQNEVELVQYKPVVLAEQSEVPHRHAARFLVIPCELLHGFL